MADDEALLANRENVANNSKKVKEYFRKRPIASTLIGGMSGLSVGMPTGSITGGAMGYWAFSGATAVVVVICQRRCCLMLF